jgi:uncharacterized membrane protein YsdA (DUF1294 family)
MILAYIVFIVYILAINFYAVMLILSQKNDYFDDDNNVSDGKLLLAALLGGALGEYITMFIARYKLKNMLFMIALPVIAVFNVWFAIFAFRSVTTFFVI